VPHFPKSGGVTDVEKLLSGPGLVTAVTSLAFPWSTAHVSVAHHGLTPHAHTDRTVMHHASTWHTKYSPSTKARQLRPVPGLRTSRGREGTFVGKSSGGIILSLHARLPTFLRPRHPPGRYEQVQISLTRGTYRDLPLLHTSDYEEMTSRTFTASPVRAAIEHFMKIPTQEAIRGVTSTPYLDADTELAR
jgi:hypothetical protein